MTGRDEPVSELLLARVHSLLQRATAEVDIRLLLLYVASRSLQRVSIAKPFPPKAVLLNTADSDDDNNNNNNNNNSNSNDASSTSGTNRPPQITAPGRVYTPSGQQLLGARLATHQDLLNSQDIDDELWDKLDELFDSSPHLLALREAGIKGLRSMSPPLLRLLDWAGTKVPGPKLKLLKGHELETTLHSWSADLGSVRPTAVFSLIHPDPSDSWNTLLEKHGSTTAFHGSSLENWHSIVSTGMSVNFVRSGGLFGDGLYLSEELSVCLGYMISRATWPSSEFGAQDVACIGAAQVIRHPQDTEVGVEDKTESMTGSAAPPQYVVVRADGLIRLTHLLVYAPGLSSSMSAYLKAANDSTASNAGAGSSSSTSPSSSSSPSANSNNHTNNLAPPRQRKISLFAIVIVLYAALLLYMSESWKAPAVRQALVSIRRWAKRVME